MQMCNTYVIFIVCDIFDKKERYLNKKNITLILILEYTILPFRMEILLYGVF